MSERRNSLNPPPRRDAIDPGAHDLAEASDSEDHFTDALSGRVSPAVMSPIPRTRVERVDDKPAYGEVPGTEAWKLRQEDAEPDEIAIIPDPSSPAPEPVARSPTPGGHPIPRTVVEETPDTEGSVTHPHPRERRMSDAKPDVVIKPDGKIIVEEGGTANDTPMPSLSLSTPPSPARARRKSSSASRRSQLSPRLPSAPDGPAVGEEEGQEENPDDEFGDEFDDFEEGGEDGDFGDFDDGFQQAEPVAPPPPPSQPQPTAPAAPALNVPIPSFESLEASEILSISEPYLTALFPQADPSFFPPLQSFSLKDNPIFLTPRSASLWQQLVAPPPLQPPDWIRSRIRRLFLVSLGVPVDLDEILPASSKQKKLVLPSLNLRRSSSSGSFQEDSEARKSGGDGGGAKNINEKGDGADGSAAGDAPNAECQQKSEKSADDGKLKDSKKSGASSTSEPERLFDLISARQSCLLTDEALHGMTDVELRAHVARLEAMMETAQRVLTYWQKCTDEKIGDREAFEGVIENLVKHARKVRK